MPKPSRTILPALGYNEPTTGIFYKNMAVIVIIVGFFS